jgi:hypothetical protein
MLCPRWPRPATVGLGLRVLCFTITLVGCRTHTERVAASRQQFLTGDYTHCIASLETELEDPKSEEEALRLDLASAMLAAGRPADAEQQLRVVRDRWEVLEENSLAESTAAYLTDDRRRAYSGSNYERVLLRVLLTLSDLCDDNTDALAYSLQINMKQHELFEAARGPDGDPQAGVYPPLAIGAYLHGLLREQTHRDYDAAARAYGQAAQWRPDFHYAAAAHERASHGVHSARGHGVVHVFALVGSGPTRVEVIQHPTSQALLIADRILSSVGDHELPPTIAPVKIPEIRVSHPLVETVQISSGSFHARTEVVCDVNQLAMKQYEAELPSIVARAVVRRVLKKGAVYAVKDQLAGDSQWADIALTVAGVAWEAAETADTRAWTFLPGKIQVARLELPAGLQTLTLSPLGPAPARSREISVSVENGRNTYVLLHVPRDTIVGEPLISRGNAPIR